MRRPPQGSSRGRSGTLGWTNSCWAKAAPRGTVATARAVVVRRARRVGGGFMSGCSCPGAYRAGLPRSHLYVPPAAVQEAEEDREAADHQLAGEDEPDGGQAELEVAGDEQRAGQAQAEDAGEVDHHHAHRVAGAAQRAAE